MEAQASDDGDASGAEPDNDNGEASQASQEDGAAPWWARPPRPAKSAPAKSASPVSRVMVGLPRSR